MIKKVDLRGLTCPEPVLRTKKLFDDSQVKRVEALVDDDVCVNNLQRLSRTLKATATCKQEDGFFQVVIERGESSSPLPQTDKGMPEAELNEPGAREQTVGTVIFLSKETFGDGDPELSRTLINLFLQTVLEAGHKPRAILMANSGVKLMAADSPALTVLNDFKADGVEVLACGLCLEFYKLKDQVPKEQITNMYAISEYLFAADKVLSP